MTLRKLLAFLLTFSLLPAGLPAQTSTTPAAKPAVPGAVTVTQAPPETPEQLAMRKLALQDMLQRLVTTGRILQVVAHPDDEDGAMLTLESRVKGNTAELFTFTRGEGGQNAQGAVFFDELGILRTLELLAADKEYGAEERFSHLADFGFSKTAEETYQKWGGRDVPLADLVQAVREFEPDVLVARFSGTPKDGHGHHQASAQLTVQAFADAADAKRFPNANRRNLPAEYLPRPWQASKLYTGLAGDQATLVPDESQPGALLNGKTPQEVAIHGLRHQESQGAGNWKGPIPKAYSSYKLVATANGVAKAEHETDFFNGIDTSVKALADRFPEDAATMPGLRPWLANFAELIQQAQEAAADSPEKAIKPLAEAMTDLKQSGYLHSFAELERLPGSGPIRKRLEEKRIQLRDALVLATGLEVSFTPVNALVTPPFVTPDETVPMKLTIINRSSTNIQLDTKDYPGRIGEDIAGSLGMYQGYPMATLPDSIGAGQSIRVTVRRQVSYSDRDRSPLERKSPVKDAIYQVRDGWEYDETALPSPSLRVLLPFEVDGAKFLSFTSATVGQTPVFAAPPISVTSSPSIALRRLAQDHETPLQATVQNNSDRVIHGKVALRLPKGWTSEPKDAVLSVEPGKSVSTAFQVRWPEKQPASETTVRSDFSSGGKTYSEGYHLLSRADLPDAFPYYAPAQTTISLIQAEIPARHTIGYIMGAGDTLPDNLASLGFTVHLFTDSDLASADLSGYDAIVTGVRAYGTRPDLREHNSRLLDYVKNGGTMVVQYEQDYDGFNKGKYLPYPATMGRDRVSQEEQPVTLLQPDSSVFRYPNKITDADFGNWVQERGLYFMKDWSAEYTPLLEMHDSGEPPLKGGLLIAHYGKGIYITTALSFYRELPNGVPGATRLFINLLSAGQAPLK